MSSAFVRVPVACPYTKKSRGTQKAVYGHGQGHAYDPEGVQRRRADQPSTGLSVYVPSMLAWASTWPSIALSTSGPVKLFPSLRLSTSSA